MAHPIESKICCECGRRKHIRYFHAAPGGYLGLRGECKSCTNLRRVRNTIKKARLAARIQFAQITCPTIAFALHDVLFTVFPVLGSFLGHN